MADIIRIGDIVTDENQSGIVLRISNNLVTWRSSTTGRVFRTSMSKLRKDDGRSKPIENQNVAAPINQGKGSDPNIQGGNINRQQTQRQSQNHYYVKYKTKPELQLEKTKHNALMVERVTKRDDLIPSARDVILVETNNIESFRRDPNVVLVENVPYITYHDEINDIFYNNNFSRDQLYLENIGHRDAIEEFGFGSYSPLLGMMDGSVLSENLPFTDKPPHPDLEGKVTYYQDTNDITVLSQNSIGHGTAVASIITTNTNNEFGMGGTCPNCSLVYFDSLYSGGGLFPLLEGGIELGVRAANISMGGTQEYWNPGSQIIQDAINDAYNQGLILVVSAGNDGIDIANEFYTYCSYDNTLCVTTSNQYNTDSSGNFIDVSAPIGECAAAPIENVGAGSCMDAYGNNVDPWSDECYFRGFNGTSSSAPVVTGLVGLLLSHNPNLTSQDIYDIVTLTNINSSVGNRPGTIDFYEALSYMYDNYMTSPPLVPGDINEDGVINILDVVQLVDAILETPLGENLPASTMPQADFNGDGFIDILDIVVFAQTILNESSTSEADKDILNLQLKRLDIPIAFSEGRRQRNKQRPMFRGSFLLTFEESNQIKLSNTLPEDLVNVSGQMQCLGKDNAYPCYFVPSEIEEPLTRRENNSTNRGMISNRRNINFTVSENRAFYSFDINNLESNLGMNLNSDFIILATCGTNETTVGFERLFQTGNDSVLVHVMGISTIDATVNYCETGETPKFFLHNTENNNEMQIPNIGRKPFIYNGNYTIP